MKKILLSTTLLLSAFFIFSSEANAASVSIGQGLTCTDRVAMNDKNKVVKISKVSTTISNLQATAQKQTGAKKKKTQDKIKIQKDIKKLVSACNKGSYDSAQTNFPQGLTSLVGTHTATYKGTFENSDKTGTVSATFSEANGVFSGAITFTGYIADTLLLPSMSFSVDTKPTANLNQFYTTAVGTGMGDLPVQIYAQTSKNGGVSIKNAEGRTNFSFSATTNVYSEFGFSCLYGVMANNTFIQFLFTNN